jgi:hypothetical protein
MIQITPATHDCHRSNILNLGQHRQKGWIKLRGQNRPVCATALLPFHDIMFSRFMQKQQ